MTLGTRVDGGIGPLVIRVPRDTYVLMVFIL